MASHVRPQMGLDGGSGGEEEEGSGHQSPRSCHWEYRSSPGCQVAAGPTGELSGALGVPLQQAPAP